MKRFIYTAVALIMCASVFGIADYINAGKKGALVNYTDDVATTEAVAEKKTEIKTPVKQETMPTDVKKELKKTTESKITKKAKDKHYTEVVPNLVVTETTKEPAIEKIDPITLLLQSKATDVNNDSTIQVESKRKISMEMFSRAPIREKKFKKK